jgi:hypothetical protein
MGPLVGGFYSGRSVAKKRPTAEESTAIQAIPVFSYAGDQNKVFSLPGRSLGNCCKYGLPTLAYQATKPSLPNDGVYKPSDFKIYDGFFLPAPLEPYGHSLSIFNGTNPNGTWSLYAQDDQPGCSKDAP